jgi:predicted glycogen debranching enzyme
MNTQSTIANSQSAEWLEADGHGGFASGTVAGIRTRRYHALLLAARTPPTGRMVLVNGFDAWIETPQGRFALSSQNYAPGVVSPDGVQHVQNFSMEPWPSWTFRFGDSTELTQELFVAGEVGITALAWRVLNKRKGVKLFVRPFLSGRDYHSLHQENSTFRFDPTLNGEKVWWRPYDGVPGIYAMYSHNGHYSHDPQWYHNFLYEEERARGLDDSEDLASPGVFDWDLSAGAAVWLLTTADSPALSRKGDMSVKKFYEHLRELERSRRSEFQSPLHRAADAYIVDGHKGKTIVAGYPWFTDWGRDTFIALRGLCLATGRFEDARDILLSWTDSVSEGMLPNRFPDNGEQPEYNSVDASLWFVVAVHELLQASNGSGIVSAKNKRALQNAVEQILEGYSRGTRFGIRMDSDGLLACGIPGVQLTWMDAKVDDWVVTPRIGKPVEIQALWLNALKVASLFSEGWAQHFQRGLNSFREKFWNEKDGFLYDVIDVDHQTGKIDASFRANQIFAVGGLPFQLLDRRQAERVVAIVQEKLLTPLGLRSLARQEPGYVPYYQGGVRQRDGAYHQGTVWPWLMGPFVEAWIRVRNETAGTKLNARRKFLASLLAHFNEAGLGHVSEIADAESPFTPRGCPWQAWSLGELLRLDQVVLAQSNPAQTRAHKCEVSTTN